MSTTIHFGRRRCTFIKGSLLMVLIVAVFVTINYNTWSPAKDDNAIEDVVKRAYGNPKSGLKTKPPKAWDSEYAHNPCYEKDSQLFCGPAVYLMGIQYAGLNLLRKAIGLHPDVDCYATGFFSNFSDMTDIKMSDMNNYFSSFDESALKIRNGSDELCICDSGRDLARPYDLKDEYGVQFPPKYTTAAALANMYYGMKVIVILRDPTIRFIREYCALGMIQPFEDVVDDAIAAFETCENDTSRDNASCVYDGSLSGLLQAGLYDFLIENYLVQSFGSYSYKLITWDDLENSATRNATMASIFNFLDKDVPYPSDPYWDILDACFVFRPGNCNGQTITAAAKEKLTAFYSTRATIYHVL